MMSLDDGDVALPLADRLLVAGVCLALVLTGVAVGVLGTLIWLGRLPWQP